VSIVFGVCGLVVAAAESCGAGTWLVTLTAGEAGSRRDRVTAGDGRFTLCRTPVIWESRLSKVYFLEMNIYSKVRP
jgi:hypothetical protein